MQSFPGFQKHTVPTFCPGDWPMLRFFSLDKSGGPTDQLSLPVDPNTGGPHLKCNCS